MADKKADPAKKPLSIGQVLLIALGIILVQAFFFFLQNRPAYMYIAYSLAILGACFSMAVIINRTRVTPKQLILLGLSAGALLLGAVLSMLVFNLY